MQDFSLCITYNGDMFDLAFLESRMKTLHIPCDFLSFRSLDLLKQYRPYAKFFGWDNCKLKTVEQFLGTRRDDAFDGGQLIDVYYEYIRRDDPALERVLLLHNFEDVQNLARLMRIREFLSILTDSAVPVSYTHLKCGTSSARRSAFTPVSPAREFFKASISLALAVP